MMSHLLIITFSIRVSNIAWSFQIFMSSLIKLITVRNQRKCGCRVNLVDFGLRSTLRTIHHFVCPPGGAILKMSQFSTTWWTNETVDFVHFVPNLYIYLNQSNVEATQDTYLLQSEFVVAKVVCSGIAIHSAWWSMHALCCKQTWLRYNMDPSKKIWPRYKVTFFTVYGGQI